MNPTPSAWRNFSGNYFAASLEEILSAAVQKELKDGHQLKICIGTDSQVSGKITEFASVVVLLRVKQGGKLFVRTHKEKKPYSLYERMITEVAYSIEVASSIVPIVERYNLSLEVHADINTDPKHKSESALAAARGYIKGMGFEFKAKPNAFASSCCADKFVS